MTLELFIQVLAIVLVPIISAAFWVDRTIHKNEQRIKNLEAKVAKLEENQEANSSTFNEIKTSLAVIEKQLALISENFITKPK